MTCRLSCLINLGISHQDANVQIRQGCYESSESLLQMTSLHQERLLMGRRDVKARNMLQLEWCRLQWSLWPGWCSRWLLRWEWRRYNRSRRNCLPGTVLVLLRDQFVLCIVALALSAHLSRQCPSRYMIQRPSVRWTTRSIRLCVEERLSNIEWLHLHRPKSNQ